MRYDFDQGVSDMMPHQFDIEPILRQLAEGASLEATPKQVLDLDTVPHWLAAGTRVYVPFLPNADFERTFEACERLLIWGMEPVPHLPARAVKNEEELHHWLSSLARIGVSRMLLIAGDINRPAGIYANTLELLESGILAQYPFQGLGIAGHPEGHPVANSNELTRALSFKRDYAEATGIEMWVVTQFAFDADIFIHWLERNDELLGSMPVYLGLAGPTRIKNLLMYAAQCGVTVSAKAMRKNLSASRLLRPWTPDRISRKLALYKATHPGSPFQGIHLFPFGGLKQSAHWLNGLRNQSSEIVENRPDQ